MLPPIHDPKSKSQSQPRTQAPPNPYATGKRAAAPTLEPIDVIEPLEPIAVTRAPSHHPLVDPPAPPKPRRFIDKVAQFFVQALCVLILAGIVIPVAAIGVPIGGGWYLHSVWLAIIIGLAVAMPLEYVLVKVAQLMGLRVSRSLLAKKDSKPAKPGR